MEEKLVKFIQDEFLSDESEQVITKESELLISGLIDSMGIIRLVSHIEDLLTIKIPVEDLIIENFSNVTAICNYLDKKF